MAIRRFVEETDKEKEEARRRSGCMEAGEAGFRNQRYGPAHTQRFPNKPSKSIVIAESHHSRENVSRMTLIGLINSTILTSSDICIISDRYGQHSRRLSARNNGQAVCDHHHTMAEGSSVWRSTATEVDVKHGSESATTTRHARSGMMDPLIGCRSYDG
jgi:hypothetical protein